MTFLFNCPLVIFLTFFPSIVVHSSLVMKSTLDSDLIYTDSILGDNYVDSISKPIEFLGFEVGARMASPLQITNSLKTWETQSDRLKVVEYARSHEGRPLHAVFISSPKNLARLDEIKRGIKSLSDPRTTSDSVAAKIINDLPAIAWLGYSIHLN